jgi:hypothetical protein
MIKHYLTLIYRNIIKEKGYFLINLVGLSAGLACALLIYLCVRDEIRVDKFHEKGERLYQVMEFQQYAEELMTTTSTPGILAENLKIDYPEVEYAVTTTWVEPHTLSIKDHNVKAKGYSVGKDFFNIFSLPLIHGDPSQVLEDKLSIVISRDLAVKLFETSDDVVGKMVELQHRKSLAVNRRL